jgi:hypothetical protein
MNRNVVQFELLGVYIPLTTAKGVLLFTVITVTVE